MDQLQANLLSLQHQYDKESATSARLMNAASTSGPYDEGNRLWAMAMDAEVRVAALAEKVEEASNAMKNFQQNKKVSQYIEHFN